ncbi:MAG: hypothetical protein JOZ00_16305 [Mycobacterium sp.]|uniref:DUF6542 domain-containing protein n=1 Tax=Mycobacterium sp. TaxID=1785 RepID=UPI001EBC3734|nr:DUF6542 domain-containing protein [Mycobacterium sp.]MBV8788239.1 hypothetical protein [Mycobacterium sp.]
MSAQRAKSAVEVSHRSAHPNIGGVPWYAAVLIAVTATAIGYGIDAGHKDLTHVFAGFYIAGCVAAVLAVRQDGIFTTIIQPPLILFCAVPGAYWLFHDGKVGSLKDLLINCGYPLIERFPLMLGTAGGVLAIGLIRWYLGNLRMTGAAKESDDDADDTGAKSIVGGLVAKLASLIRPETDTEDADDASAGTRRRRTSSSSKARRTARSSRSTTRSSRTRSRHTREGLDDGAESAERSERPRRSARRGATARDYDADEPPRRPRRRPRPDGDPDPRGQSAREGRREPRTRRNPYERPRSSRFDDYDGYEPPASPGSGRYESRFGADERYDLFEPSYEPRRRRPAPNGAGSTHHPISQVRYRGSAGSEQPTAEPRSERRSRSRAHGRSQGRPPAESWEYDV